MQILYQRRDQLLLLSFGAAKRRTECAALAAGLKRPNPRLPPMVWRRRDYRVRSSHLVLVLRISTRRSIRAPYAYSLSGGTAAAVVYDEYKQARAMSALLGVARTVPAPADFSLAAERSADRRLRTGREGKSRYHHPTHRSFGF